MDHVTYGWHWAFIVTGAIGFLWLAFWLPFYPPPDEHPRVSAAELAHIQSDPPEPAVHVSRGASSFRIARRGRSRSASS